jgi:glycosyltransferase involved in cell wall biosynthesis
MKTDVAPRARSTTAPDRPQLSRPVVLDARVVTGTGGGPEKTILNSPRYLERDGYRMICAYMHPPDDAGFDELRRRASSSDATLISVPDRGALDVRVLSRLLGICRSENVAIWHGHDYKSNILGILLRKLWPMRLVTTCHGWVRHTKRTPLYYSLDRMSLRHFERVFCVSEDLRESCIQAGVDRDRCILLENGVDTESFRRTRTKDEAKKALGLSPARFLIGAAGRLSGEKGFSTLIRAVDELLARGRNLSLWIAGEGGEEEELSRLIVDRGRCDRIRLIGYHSDLRPFYEALDLFVLSSLREGLPNVLLEALAYEVPVVATAVNGIPGLIGRRQCGVLVEPGSDEALARAIEGLFDDPPRRQDLGRRGRTVVENEYSFTKRMHTLARIYDGMLGREAS